LVESRTIVIRRKKFTFYRKAADKAAGVLSILNKTVILDAGRLPSGVAFVAIKQ